MKRWCYSRLHLPVACLASPSTVYCMDLLIDSYIISDSKTTPDDVVNLNKKQVYSRLSKIRDMRPVRQKRIKGIFRQQRRPQVPFPIHNIIANQKKKMRHHQQHLTPAPHDDHPESVRSFRSGNHHATFRPRQPSILAMLGQHPAGSRVEMLAPEEKQHSVRSFNTTKTTSRVSYKPVLETQLYEDLHLLPPEEEAANYEAIERILKNENQNLKCQNELLLKEVHKLKKHNYQYRQQYRQARVELEQAREQCEAQKRRADQMKDMIMSRLAMLEGKLNCEGSSHFAIQECESILEALTFSESEIK